MDIKLERNDLDKSIEVLSNAAQAFKLTRFENLSYRVLMLSVDVATTTLVAAVIDALFREEDWADVLFLQEDWVAGVLAVVCVLSILVGLVSLMLNIPLFVRVFRERARLKTLGLSSLSRSLWIERRRSRWISRARGYLLIGASIFLVAVGVELNITGWTTVKSEDRIALFVSALSFALIAALLYAARYLRNQRERIDLAANAEELRSALQSLRHRAGGSEIVTVPSEDLERTAKIESAQIIWKRRDAVLQSIESPSKGYAVAFDRGAVEQRAALDIADRIELEDLVEELSAEAAELRSQAGAGASVAAPLQAVTRSKRIEVDYLIDQTSRRIRITAVRSGISGSPASPNGASHA